jgi:hypothetical protein
LPLLQHKYNVFRNFSSFPAFLQRTIVCRFLMQFICPLRELWQLCAREIFLFSNQRIDIKDRYEADCGLSGLAGLSVINCPKKGKNGKCPTGSEGVAMKRKALLVGINDYAPKGGEGPDLGGCLNDVRDVAHTLNAL